MNKQEHTLEPWKVESGEIVKSGLNRLPIAGMVRDDSAYQIPPTERDANAKRIVACVNACAGMDDPAKEIETLQELLRIAMEQLHQKLDLPNQ